MVCVQLVRSHTYKATGFIIFRPVLELQCPLVLPQAPLDSEKSGIKGDLVLNRRILSPLR